MWKVWRKYTCVVEFRVKAAHQVLAYNWMQGWALERKDEWQTRGQWGLMSLKICFLSKEKVNESKCNKGFLNLREK